MEFCRFASVCVFAVLLPVLSACGADPRETASSAVPGDETESQAVYEGRTLDEWRQVMKSLDLTSPAAAEVVPGLMAVCRSPQVPDQTRAQAAYTLGRIGETAEAAVPLLIELLQSPTSEDSSPTARWSAKGLALFGPRAASATPALVKVATSEGCPLPVRLAAIETLGRIGGAHPGAIPALMQLAATNSRSSENVYETHQQQAAAIDSLAMTGPPAAPAVPLLIRLTRETSGDLRKRAATALGAVGSAAGIAAETLVDLVLFDELPEVRDAAAASLAAVGEAGERGLRQLLTDEEDAVRRRAAAAFVGVKPLTDTGRASLVQALEDEDVDVRLSAVEALHQAGHQQPPLLAVLLEAFTEQDRSARIRGYRLLISMPTATSVLPQLQSLADDDRPYVRQAARKAITELNAPEAVCP